MASLPQQLWLGPLADPAAPGRKLLRESDYATALKEARLLVRLALPVDLAALQARWPWSIDLAWLSLVAERDAAPLKRTVTNAGRRFGTLAWGLWSLGEVSAALESVRDLDPSSPGFDDDVRARAELHILSDLATELPSGPEGERLSLLQTYRREGAEALARRLTLDAAALPAHAPLWLFLVDTFIAERDFARARNALSLFEARLPGHPQITSRQVRLLLDAERPDEALSMLNTLGDGDAPWRWPLRRHLQYLRALADRIARGDRPDYGPMRTHAEAALRLHPRSTALTGQWLLARELTEDWEALAADLQRHADHASAAASLLRLGIPEQALACLDKAHAATPDETFRLRLRRAEALKMTGNLAAAREALGPPPEAAPLRADHAYWAAEIDAAARDLDAARQSLTPALTAFPSRMGLHLTAARVAFQGAADAEAAGHLAAFHALKTAQTGTPPEGDLRDLIVRDAAVRPQGPGAAARVFAAETPAFVPLDTSAIPRRIAHYWEGPPPPGLPRSLRAWAKLYPQTVFDADSARAWLARHTSLAPLFDRLTQPATRADLFRVALIAKEGGIFADLDDYPRSPIDDWFDGAELVLVIEEGHGTLANNFIAARPALPLFRRLLDRIAETLETTADPYPWWHSGPAPLTQEALAGRHLPGRRFLTQADYDARISTNLPFAHKRGPTHWR